ncbi:polysaccharide transporter, PST family [Trichlorobacter thiogenes]|uniref:Polysaccharide transporter, PST family n=2 Tax=Trichlorobacter thiogenes TaxID=115783 RepID=A0A1T4MLM6_9BACT|nr:polysaccharide transporter, PST family [Trichlorobacter thiogenes]
MGIGLIVGVWVARYLGPEQFGAFNFAIAFVALFGAFVSLGLDSIVVRDIVREPEKKHEILSSAFVLKLCGGCIAFIMAWASIFVIRPADSQAHWLVGIIASGMIFQSLDTIDLWFQSQVQSKYTVLAKNGAFVVLACVKVILILNKAPLTTFAWAALAEIILAGVGLLLFYLKQQTFRMLWHPSLDRSIRLFNSGWPLILSGMLIMIYMKIDQIMLGSMMGDKAVGVYSAATKVSEVWYFIPTVISVSIYPTLIESYHKSEELFYHKLKMIMGYLFWGSLLLGMIITRFSREIVALMYGASYAEASSVLSIHIYSGVVVSMGIVFSQKYILDNTTRVSMIGTALGAIANVLLNLWLIDKYGINGAAISTLVSYIVPTVSLGLLVDKRILTTHIESIYYVLNKENYAKFN